MSGPLTTADELGIHPGDVVTTDYSTRRYEASEGILARPASVVISLPFPPPACHPNSRAGWRAKARGMAESRQIGFFVARQAWPLAEPLPHWERAQLTVQPVYPDRRRRDADGLLSSLKGAIDGIVDAGILRDDDQLTITVLPPVVDKARVGAELTISGDGES